MEMTRRDMLRAAAFGVVGAGVPALAESICRVPVVPTKVGLVKFDLAGIEALEKMMAIKDGRPFGGVFDKLPYSKIHKPGADIFLTDEFSFNLFRWMSVSASKHGIHFNIDFETVGYDPLEYYNKWCFGYEVYCDGVLVPGCFAAYVSRDGKQQSVAIQYQNKNMGSWILRTGVIQILRTQKLEQEERMKYAEFNPKYVVFPDKTADEYVGYYQGSDLIPTKYASFRGAREYSDNETGGQKIMSMFTTGEFSYVAK